MFSQIDPISCTRKRQYQCTGTDARLCEVAVTQNQKGIAKQKKIFAESFRKKDLQGGRTYGIEN